MQGNLPTIWKRERHRERKTDLSWMPYDLHIKGM